MHVSLIRKPLTCTLETWHRAFNSFIELQISLGQYQRSNCEISTVAIYDKQFRTCKCELYTFDILGRPKLRNGASNLHTFHCNYFYKRVCRHSQIIDAKTSIFTGTGVADRWFLLTALT